MTFLLRPSGGEQPSPRGESLAQVALLAVSATALGLALEARLGQLSPAALGWLTASWAALLAGALVRSPRAPLRSPRAPLRTPGAPLRSPPALEQHGDALAIALLAALVCAELALLFSGTPGYYLQPGTDLRIFRVRLMFAGLLALSLAFPRPLLPRARMPVLLLAHLVLGVFVLRASPAPDMDVFVFHREAINAALHGHNPWAITFTDIYRDRYQVYGEGLARDGRVLFGFPYPPLSFALAFLAQVAFGDHRVAMLLAFTATGGLIAYARPGRLAELCAALWLFSPRGFFVLENSWTDPLVAFFLALTVFTALRAPRLLPFALGLLFASKQYAALLAAPFAVFLLPQPARARDTIKLLAKAALVALAVTLPGALLDLRAFVDDVILLQLRQPFRPDSLSYTAWLVSRGGPRLPAWLSFVVLLPAAALSFRRLPRTPGGFAFATALAAFAFLAVSKQAFCNYYQFVIAALCCAAGAISPAAIAAGATSPAPPAHPRAA